jgi:hypothetical protein
MKKALFNWLIPAAGDRKGGSQTSSRQIKMTVDWTNCKQAVLGIPDILVRIRIRGSAPLTNESGSGSNSGSRPFFSDFKDAKKILFFS